MCGCYHLAAGSIPVRACATTRRGSRACAAVFGAADTGLNVQRSELETLLAMERAARAAVEKASVNSSRSNVGTPFQTPSRTATRSKGNAVGNLPELHSPLLEDDSQGAMVPSRAQVLLPASHASSQ